MLDAVDGLYAQGSCDNPVRVRTHEGHFTADILQSSLVI